MFHENCIHRNRQPAGSGWLAGCHGPTSALEPAFSKCVAPRATQSDHPEQLTASLGEGPAAPVEKACLPSSTTPGAPHTRD